MVIQNPDDLPLTAAAEGGNLQSPFDSRIDDRAQIRNSKGSDVRDVHASATL
jgi:hypothetical protein